MVIMYVKKYNLPFFVKAGAKPLSCTYLTNRLAFSDVATSNRVCVAILCHNIHVMVSPRVNIVLKEMTVQGLLRSFIDHDFTLSPILMLAYIVTLSFVTKIKSAHQTSILSVYHNSVPSLCYTNNANF
jgi:hypothetical protein